MTPETLAREPSLQIDQSRIEDVGRSMWDVIVIGAGAAGGVAATVLASRGLQVLLVDRVRFPREKICGDALSPKALQVLQATRLLGAIRPWALESFRYTMVAAGGASVDIACPLTMVRRQVLDTLVVKKAVAGGAVFAQGSLEKIAVGEDGVECVFGSSSHRCRVLVVATGASHETLRMLGIVGAMEPDGVAVRRYYRSSVGPDHPCFFFNKALLPGYAWIFPVGGQDYNVGCGRFSGPGRMAKDPLHRLFERFLQEDEMASRLVANGAPASPLSGGILRCGVGRVPPVHRGRVLLAGEAIGTTIPGWGEGISQAMETGMMAAEAILGADNGRDVSRLGEYAKRVAKEIKPATRRNELFAWLFSYAWATDLLVNVARRSSLVRGLLAKEKVEYTSD